ncbi:MAG: heparinase II/III family protein, partial [Aeromicrobium sp.]
MRRILITITLCVIVASGNTFTAAADDSESEPQCFGSYYDTQSNDESVAAALMAGKLTLPTFGTWNLPAHPKWTEDPFKNRNWVQQFQTLRWLDPLRREGQRLNDQAMLNRYTGLIREWLSANPYGSSKSDLAWYDMVVGSRSLELVCAKAVAGTATWLSTAMTKHAKVLSDPDEYATVGNHALYQDIGLLALGCTTSTPAWSDLAVTRSSKLLEKSVDDQGVTDEGSTNYQLLNYIRYSEMKRHVELCGLTPQGPFERIPLMTDFLSQATQPNGRMVAFGDTNAITDAKPIPGTVAEYAATQGASGPVPTSLFTVYKRGYAFSRTGWFDTQSADEQAQAAIRFGPALKLAIHGHEDAGAVSYYAMGSQLLWTPGYNLGGASDPRRYVKSNEAQNVIDIPGLTYNSAATSPLGATLTTPT